MNNTHMIQVARNQHGLDASYHWSMMKVVDQKMGLTLIELGQRRVLTKGPRKGQEVPKPPYFKAYVTQYQGEQEQSAYEARTGNCGECLGEGRVFAGWHHIEGDKFAECRKCNASGKATARPPSPQGEE